jgi:hypothetical protein
LYLQLHRKCYVRKNSLPGTIQAGAEDAHGSESPAAALCSGEATEENIGKRFAKARIDASGRARPSRLAEGAQNGTINIYERQLNHGRQRRLRQISKGMFANAVPRQPLQDPMNTLKSALQERGFKDAIDAYSFFDVSVSNNFAPAGYDLSSIFRCL